MQEQLKKAGFKMTIANQSAGDLFGTTLAAGDYVVSLYAQMATSLQPGLCTILCASNIPTPANDNSGQNWQRVDTAAERAAVAGRHQPRRRGPEVGRPSRRTRSWPSRQVSLPLDPLPNILLWSKKIVGPVHDDPVLGMFGNINQWGLKK